MSLDFAVAQAHSKLPYVWGVCKFLLVVHFNYVSEIKRDIGRKRALGETAASPGPPLYTKCNSPPINGQSTNHRPAV